MYKNKKIGAVIVAAGSGNRMNSEKPKQFLKIKGRPIGFLSTDPFISCEQIDEVIFVTKENYFSFCKDNLMGAKIVVGGRSRKESVVAGIKALSSETDYVLIHDGARPFVDNETIVRVINDTLTKGATVCGVKPKDTIRKKEYTLNRDELFSVQTPQGFRKDIIMEAYDRALENGFEGTDDASVVEQLGIEVSIVEGSYNNIKITTKEDIPMENRVGLGYDVHKLVEGRALILGGVEIPFEKGLLGHSDADVLTHAVMDALLGAAGLGDIGKHFPDTDIKYKNARSIQLLKLVKDKLEEKGYEIVNIDVTLLGERPKISKYTEEMKGNIEKATGVDIDQINIKGTTTEKLGFVGREEGLAAQAVCLLNRRNIV